MSKKEYALYKGEQLLEIGAIEEIAKKQGVKKKTIAFYGRPVYMRRRANSKKGNYKVLVNLDDE